MKRCWVTLAVVLLVLSVTGLVSCSSGENQTGTSPTATQALTTTGQANATTSQSPTSATSTSANTSAISTTAPASPTSSTPPTSTTVLTTTAPATTTQATAEPTELSDGLAEALANAAGISSVYYDMVTTAPGEPQFTASFWIKGGKMRSEMDNEGELVVMLLNNEENSLYMYMPGQNMAMRLAYEPSQSAVDETVQITQHEPVVTGTETLDGKVCLVIEYSGGGTQVKTWIWKDRGFPLKVETVTGQGTMIVEYKNISFDNISDDMFEIPAGVDVIEYPVPGT